MKMKVSLDQIGSGLKFNAENPGGSQVEINADGMRPMELLLAATASCAAFDLIHILKKQKQPLEDVKINACGIRPDEGHVKPFTSIDLEFLIYGMVDKTKAERAVSLSVEKYCSVRSSLHPNIPVNYSIKYFETAEK
jgi:putative redox protein